MQPVRIGQYSVSTACTDRDIEQAQAMRQTRFRFDSAQTDADRFDEMAQHLLIRDRAGDLRASCRMMVLACADDFATSYAAQVYDLSRIAACEGVVLELGRLCLAPMTSPDADTLRALWAGIGRVVADTDAGIVIGCSSFPGADPVQHSAVLSHLRAHHLGPVGLRPDRRATHTVTLPQTPLAPAREVLRAMPPLLRMYLGLGGWVSDHAVIDRDLDTLHVFTALDLAAIPAARARSLRQLAAA